MVNQSFNLLPWLVFVPVIGAVAIALIPRERPESLKLVAVLTSSIAGALSIFMLADFDTKDAGFQFVTNHTWVKGLGIGWHLGVDGISGAHFGSFTSHAGGS